MFFSLFLTLKNVLGPRVWSHTPKAVPSGAKGPWLCIPSCSVSVSVHPVGLLGAAFPSVPTPLAKGSHYGLHLMHIPWVVPPE